MKKIILIFMSFFLISCATKQLTQETVKTPVRPAKIALVLGAGASKGFAHIGVIKVLENNNIPIHMVVGTSAGSFVGSFYAYGFNAYQLQKIALDIKKSDIVDLIFPDNGFIQGVRLESYVNKMLNNAVIEKLKIPFYAVATDLQTGEEVVFGRGNTGTAVRASCSIPGVFTPVKIGNKFYVDGGVVSPVAVEAAKRHGADIVIAVDISSDGQTPPPQSTIETLLQSINIMYSKLAISQLSKAEIVIRPKVGHIASYDFEKRHEAIMEGEKAALEALPKINEIINKLKSEGRL
ncbi:MAG: patatin-like phospholipase family protein [Proteobacteria bacterium]|nr:patatin-like phospholipase family protein [Pseudomonadota bacterium]